MAGDAEHITMLQRSPSYIFSLPALDKISEFLGRFLPAKWVYGLARKRNIAVQRRHLPGLPPLADARCAGSCSGWSDARSARAVDMSHFTPNYMPWDERLCAVPNGDLFKVLKSGEASVVTDQIDTFTENGILLKSGRELEADIIVTATGLNVQMLGGMELFVDGEARKLQRPDDLQGCAGGGHPQPGLDRRIHQRVVDPEVRHRRHLPLPPAQAHGRQRPHGGHAPRCRGLRDGHRHVRPAAVPAMCSARRTPCRAKASKHPWKVLMHYEKDSKMLLEDPVDDGLLQFDRTAVGASVA